MLKLAGNLKYLTAIALISGCAIYVSHQYQKARDGCDRECDQAENETRFSAVHHELCDECQQNTERNFPRWYRLFSWPEGITAWAIILTLIAIAEQTAQTRVAAEAALLNAKAVINAERPWIMVSVKSPPGPMGGFTVYARNKGRTPAMVTEARIGCVAVKNVSELPPKAVFPIANPIQNKIIIPGGAAHVIWFDQRLFKAVLKDSLPQFSWDGQIFVFGKVLYRDLANPDKTVIHETRWIGLYQPPVGDEGGNSIFRVEGIGISDEYDRYT
jgi:hypothetical protein